MKRDCTPVEEMKPVLLPLDVWQDQILAALHAEEASCAFWFPLLTVCHTWYTMITAFTHLRVISPRSRADWRGFERFPGALFGRFIGLKSLSIDDGDLFRGLFRPFSLGQPHCLERLEFCPSSTRPRQASDTPFRLHVLTTLPSLVTLRSLICPTLAGDQFGCLDMLTNLTELRLHGDCISNPREITRLTNLQRLSVRKPRDSKHRYGPLNLELAALFLNAKGLRCCIKEHLPRLIELSSDCENHFWRYSGAGSLHSPVDSAVPMFTGEWVDGRPAVGTLSMGFIPGNLTASMFTYYGTWPLDRSDGHSQICRWSGLLLYDGPSQTVPEPFATQLRNALASPVSMSGAL